MSDRLLPVTVVGGYLGAGKTTLVNHVLRSADRPIAVLVNDFGDLDVDASLLGANDGDVVSFANGCVCCDLSDGLVAALDRIRAASPAPERVLIEASGVGELATIANYAALPGLRLDATVCVVDAESIRERSSDRWVGDLVVRQLRDADLVVCNRTDVVDEDRRADARARIAEVAPDAVVIETAFGRVDLDVLFDAEPTATTRELRTDDDSTGNRRRGGQGETHAHGADASTGFVAWVRVFTTPVPVDELRTALAQLPSSVARAKGVVHVVDDGRERAVLVQMVGRRCELSTVESEHGDTSALSFIAVRGGFDGRTIPELFGPAPID